MNTKGIAAILMTALSPSVLAHPSAAHPTSVLQDATAHVAVHTGEAITVAALVVALGFTLWKWRQTNRS